MCLCTTTVALLIASPTLSFGHEGNFGLSLTATSGCHFHYATSRLKFVWSGVHALPSQFGSLFSHVNLRTPLCYGKCLLFNFFSIPLASIVISWDDLLLQTSW